LDEGQKGATSGTRFCFLRDWILSLICDNTRSIVTSFPCLHYKGGACVQKINDDHGRATEAARGDSQRCCDIQQSLSSLVGLQRLSTLLLCSQRLLSSIIFIVASCRLFLSAHHHSSSGQGRRIPGGERSGLVGDMLGDKP